MNLNRNRALILILALVFVMAFLSFFAWKLEFNPKTFFDNSLNNKDKGISTFSRFKESSESTVSNESVQVPPVSKELSAEDIKAMVAQLEVKTPDPSKDWDYKTDIFIAEIKGVDSINQKLLLNFSSPEKLPFVGQEKWVKVTCSPTDMYIEKNGSSTNMYFPLFDYAQIGNKFTSLCKEAICTEVGDLCRLYQ